MNASIAFAQFIYVEQYIEIDIDLETVVSPSWDISQKINIISKEISVGVLLFYCYIAHIQYMKKWGIASKWFSWLWQRRKPTKSRSDIDVSMATEKCWLIGFQVSAHQMNILDRKTNKVLRTNPIKRPEMG